MFDDLRSDNLRRRETPKQKRTGFEREASVSVQNLSGQAGRVDSRAGAGQAVTAVGEVGSAACVWDGRRWKARTQGGPSRDESVLRHLEIAGSNGPDPGSDGPEANQTWAELGDVSCYGAGTADVGWGE
jgi:hypothetical protein